MTDKLPNFSHQLEEGEKLKCVVKTNGMKVYVVTGSSDSKRSKRVNGKHLLDLMDYIYENKKSIIDPVNALDIRSSIMTGYNQRLNSVSGNNFEKMFKKVFEEEGINAKFINEPEELKQIKEFDHFIEFNGEYYGIEQKKKDNHDHRKDLGEFAAIKNFPNEYNGKKINKYIWFVSEDKGKTPLINDYVLRGEEIFSLFVQDEEECTRLYKKFLSKNKKINIESVFDLDSNYENKIDFLFKCGKNPREYKKFIMNEDWMKCIKSLSKKNKFVDKFVEEYNNYTNK